MKRRPWNGQELLTLMERFLVEGPIRLAQEMGRSKDSVSSFARRCGLRTQRKPYRHRNHGSDSDLKKTTGT